MIEHMGHIERGNATETPTAKTENGINNTLDKMREGKAKAIRGFVNNRGLFVGIIIICIVIFAYTTKIDFDSTTEFVRFGLSVFIFMFCSYAMYVNCADSGTKAGKNTALYTDTQAQYNELKNRIVSQNKQIHLGEFCRLYVDDELMNSRKDVLDEVGYDYNEYVEKWVGADRATIESNCGLTNREKDAIITANSMKAVKLTPEMILKRERGNKRRTPLGISPVDRRNLKHTMKLITTVLTSLFTCMIGFDIIVNPSWATFAELCIKLLMIVLNGFFGYQTGYENITVHTVDYVHDQIDLLHQFEQYLMLKEQAVGGQKE